MEAAERSGQLVSIADFEQVLGEMIMAARSRLLVMPSRLAPLVAAEADPAVCERLIRDVVYEALEELARGGEPQKQESK